MIHFFGDSFTACQGCRPGDEYYERTYDGTQKTWVEMISEDFNQDFINHGLPGVGNQKILDEVTRNLHTINKNDIIFLSRTNDSRFSVPNNKGYMEDVLITMLVDRTHQYKLWDDDYYDAVKSYIEYVLLPNSNVISERFDYIFDSFNRYFLSNSNQSIIWNVDDHLLDKNGKPKYSIISDEQPDIFDGHWSWNGHIQFYNFIKTIL